MSTSDVSTDVENKLKIADNLKKVEEASNKLDDDDRFAQNVSTSNVFPHEVEVKNSFNPKVSVKKSKKREKNEFTQNTPVSDDSQEIQTESIDTIDSIEKSENVKLNEENFAIAQIVSTSSAFCNIETKSTIKTNSIVMEEVNQKLKAEEKNVMSQKVLTFSVSCDNKNERTNPENSRDRKEKLKIEDKSYLNVRLPTPESCNIQKDENISNSNETNCVSSGLENDTSNEILCKTIKSNNDKNKIEMSVSPNDTKINFDENLIEMTGNTNENILCASKSEIESSKFKEDNSTNKFDLPNYSVQQVIKDIEETSENMLCSNKRKIECSEVNEDNSTGNSDSKNKCDEDIKNTEEKNKILLTKKSKIECSKLNIENSDLRKDSEEDMMIKNTEPNENISCTKNFEFECSKINENGGTENSDSNVCKTSETNKNDPPIKEPKKCTAEDSKEKRKIISEIVPEHEFTAENFLSLISEVKPEDMLKILEQIE